MTRYIVYTTKWCYRRRIRRDSGSIIEVESFICKSRCAFFRIVGECYSRELLTCILVGSEEGAPEGFSCFTDSIRLVQSLGEARSELCLDFQYPIRSHSARCIDDLIDIVDIFYRISPDPR